MVDRVAELLDSETRRFPVLIFSFLDRYDVFSILSAVANYNSNILQKKGSWKLIRYIFFNRTSDTVQQLLYDS